MPNEEQIILVDENDTQIGTMGKLETHEKGLLHRAFSIIVKNSKGEIMRQKRALGKYHSGGLWSNTCCGHPRHDEELISAVQRILKEEMGFDCLLNELFVFQYQIDVPTQNIKLQENEINHVLLGEYNNAPILNSEEADDWKWITISELKKDITENPNDYTYWFKIILKKAEEDNIAFT